MHKILLITLGVGSGHNSAANALEEQFEIQGHQVKTINFYDSKSQKHLNWWNTLALKHFKGVFNYVYKRLMQSKKSFPKMFYYKQLKHVLDVIEGYKPTKIVCTHFFAMLALRKLKLGGYSIPPFYYCVTDYYPYPFAKFCKEAASVFVPNQLLKAHFAKEGVNATITGIPILNKFFEKHQKAERPTVLVTGGGSGLGNRQAIKLCKRLKAEILIANGRNTNMPELMQKAHIILGKAGGLTCTEAMVCGTPLIAGGKLALHEHGNIMYLANLGLGYYAKTKKQLLAKMTDLLHNKHEYISQDNNASQEIVRIVTQGDKYCRSNGQR